MSRVCLRFILETENVLIKAVRIDLKLCMEPCVSCIYLNYCMEYVWKSSLWIDESVYFKELHNEQGCYWPTICREGAAVVSTITSLYYIYMFDEAPDAHQRSTDFFPKYLSVNFAFNLRAHYLSMSSTSHHPVCLSGSSSFLAICSLMDTPINVLWCTKLIVIFQRSVSSLVVWFVCLDGWIKNTDFF